MILDVLNMALLRLIAFGRSSVPTISLTKAWRTGRSIAANTPEQNVSRYSIHSSTAPLRVTAASPAAHRAIPAWVATRVCRLTKRSAMTPPHVEMLSLIHI